VIRHIDREISILSQVASLSSLSLLDLQRTARNMRIAIWTFPAVMKSSTASQSVAMEFGTACCHRAAFAASAVAYAFHSALMQASKSPSSSSVLQFVPVRKSTAATGLGRSRGDTPRRKVADLIDLGDALLPRPVDDFILLLCGIWQRSRAVDDVQWKIESGSRARAVAKCPSQKAEQRVEPWKRHNERSD
jgi:hypothetical protein